VRRVARCQSYHEGGRQLTRLDHKYKNNMFSGWRVLHSAGPEEATVHMLVEEFSVFGIQVQYWMLIAVAIIVAGVTAAWWTGLGS
jgi:hypothetical protein